MQEGWLYIKVSGVKKLKYIDRIPQDVIVVTEDVVGLHHSIPHDTCLEALTRELDNRENKKISTDDLIKMAEFVLKKTITLNLTKRSTNKFPGLPLVPN